MEIKPIAYMHSDFPGKFGIPRQSGLVEELKGKIVFEKDYAVPEAFRGLDGYSHIWILWEFSEAVRKEWSPTVRPPRLGGNTRLGVFATRSPFRPNPLGLSCVKLEGIEYSKTEGPVLLVSGADLMDRTPIYDIKPYLPLADCHPEALSGFAAHTASHHLGLEMPETYVAFFSPEQQKALIGVLAEDPRPSYQHDPDRVYAMPFAGYDVCFKVKDLQLTVCDVRPLCTQKMDKERKK